MSEHLRNVNLGWVAMGWFIAAAIASLILLALASFGIGATDAEGETVWVGLALLAGFLGAGILVGLRVAAAPLLNGVAMAVFSVIAWLLVNLLAGGPTGETTWRSLPALSLAGLLVLQTVAAVVGARIGVRWTRGSARSR